jgi:uncharacterized protein YuzE
MATLRRQNASQQAYTLVDVNSIDDDELRKDILLDASEGGGIYGIRVVEESVNGPIRAPVYGYYNGTEFEDRWNAAKDQLGLGAEEVDDAAVRGGGGALDVTDPRTEAALREQAEESARVQADRQRASEDSEVAQVTGQEVKSNITDPTLSPDATNRADDPAAAAAASDAAAKAAKNKAPK